MEARIILASLAALAAGGCASGPNPPLIFGQTQTVGLFIGSAAAQQGADLVLGYKDEDIAIVPVSIHQPDGRNTQLTAEVGGETDRSTDAYAVFGHFGLGATATPTAVPAESGGSAAPLRLGKFFATGLAARYLADGYQCRLAGTGCPAGQDAATADAKRPHPRRKAAPKAAAQPAGTDYAGPSLPLVFGQSHTLGIGLGGGPNVQSISVTFGYRDRNIALVPVVVDQPGIRTELSADVACDDTGAERVCGGKDAFSVLGSFEVNADALARGVALGKFFTTGIAARSLAQGFQGAVSGAAGTQSAATK